MNQNSKNERENIQLVMSRSLHLSCRSLMTWNPHVEKLTARSFSNMCLKRLYANKSKFKCLLPLLYHQANWAPAL